MKPLLTRILSAIFAALLVLGSYYFWGNDGLFMFATIIVWRVGYEFARMTFEKLAYSVSFATIVTLLFSLHFYYPGYFLMIYTIVTGLLLIFFTWLTSRGASLQKVAAMQASTVLGLFYCVLLPIYVVNIIYVGPNAFWFPVFLCIVFAGDILAYFVGIKWGRNKLLEPVSPKKTVEGSIGGILGSILVAGITAAFFSVSFWPLLLAAIGTGLFGQMGDLFESLLKRVANVKDSGRFMPGHGGMMDRLDGVYMAAPFFYLVLRTYLD